MTEFMSAKRENNMYKILDHEENLKKVQRGQSAYRNRLVEKLMEKSSRGKDIMDRKKKVTELAAQNQM